MTSARYIVGDTRDVVAAMPDGSVDLVLSSPPFLALRSYLPADHPDKWREIGSEPNPAAFVQTLLELTAEWGRVLAPHGSIAIELGDTYSGSGGAGGDYGDDGLRSGQPKFRQAQDRPQDDGGYSSIKRPGHGSNSIRNMDNKHQGGGPGWPLAKCLALIPELYRIGLAYGINPLTGAESPAGRWRVRNTVRWCRPNPPVGALGDKYRPSTSDMVIACRSDKRWFDLNAVRTEHKITPEDRKTWTVQQTGARADDGDEYRNLGNPAGAPPLDHWIIPTHPYKGAHFATFPPKLCEVPIQSMCPREVCTACGTPRRRIVKASDSYAEHLGESWADRNDWRTKAAGTERNSHSGQPKGAHIASASYETLGWTDCGCNAPFRPGIVLDPFGGSGTVGAVATGMGRDAVLVDIDDRNADLAQQRIGMFCTVEHHEGAPA